MTIHPEARTTPRFRKEIQESSRSARALLWVYVEIHDNKRALTAAGFLSRLIKKAAFKIHIVLTDNGREFTDRFIPNGERVPTGEHEFDRACNARDIDHRLIKPRHPQTNGMVERFNGRIAEILRATTFPSAAELETTLQRYVRLHHHQIPQKALDHQTPIQKRKDWRKKQPELFLKRVYHQAGPDT